MIADQKHMPDRSDSVSLVELLRTLWHRKWLGLCAVIVCLVAGAAYALTATDWYRAEVTLAPADETTTQGIAGGLGALSGLANMAGISVGGGDTVEAIAVLRSRDFARRFIEENDLLTVLLYEQWNVDEQRWKVDDPAEAPDIRDAISFFDDNVRTVVEDTRTGLVTVTVNWVDANVAAEWANALVDRLNDNMRQRALFEAEANIDYLRDELESTSLTTMQQSIGSLLETELQKVMLARGNKEFAFTVIDRAQVPKEPYRPRTIMILAVALAMGALTWFLIVLVDLIGRRMRRTDG